MTALDVLHRQAQARLRGAVGATVAGSLWAVTLDRDEEVFDAYAATTARVVSAGQRQAAQFAAAYIGTLAAPVRAIDQGPLLDALMTPESDSATSGLLRLWRLLDEGEDEAVARLAAGEYAGGLAETDLQGAARIGLDAAADATERRARWSLELNPSACEWCRHVAEDGYTSAEGVPIPHSPGGEHPGGACNCSPAAAFE
jgi:hypothetical protein